MPENEMIPINEGLETAQAETAKEKFERERLARRQVLKKFGMTSAMAAFALFSVDDLARMVGKAMQQQAGDNKVAAQLAKEFQQAGIAMADMSNPLASYGEYGMHCKSNTKTYGDATTCDACCVQGCDADYPSGDSASQCIQGAQDKC